MEAAFKGAALEGHLDFTLSSEISEPFAVLLVHKLKRSFLIQWHLVFWEMTRSAPITNRSELSRM